MHDANPLVPIEPEDKDPVDINAFLGTEPPRPWYRRPWGMAAIAGGALLLLLLLRLFGGSPDASYATETAKRTDLTVTVSATGNLQPTNQVEVGSEQSGLIEAVYVDNNDRVTKGQPLARLDTSRLRDTLNQARATLAAAQAAVAQSRATAAQASANLKRQEDVWRLSGGKVPAAVELEASRADAQRGLAGIRSAQAQVAQAAAQVSAAQTNLSKATIYSPVNGVVLSRAVDPGQTVAASLQAPTLFTLAEDLSQMELQVKVDEADVGQVTEGQHATFTVDAYPGRQFEAVLKRVDLGANASDGGSSGSSSSSSSASSSTVVAYTAVLSVQNRDFLLRPGMTATAEIVTQTRRNALVVPNAALRFRPAKGAKQGGGVTDMLMPRRMGGRAERNVTIGRGSAQTIYVLDEDGNPQARRVTVGSSDSNVTEITGGRLKPGEKVITAQLAKGADGSSSSSRQASAEGMRPSPIVADRRRA